MLSEGTSDGLALEIANELELPSQLVVNRSQRWGRLNQPSKASGQETAVATSGCSSKAKTPHHQRLRTLARNTRDLFLATPDKNIAWCFPTLRKALAMVRQHKPHVILTSGPPHSTHLIGMALKRLTGIAWVADFRDPWARRPWGLKSENPWGQRLLGRFERSCIRQADRIILNTTRMRDDFRDCYRNLHAENFVAIPNGCDPQMTEMIRSFCHKESGHSQEPVPSRFVLCHPGSVYRKRDPRPLVKAIAALRRDGVCVELEQIGACDSGFALEEFIAEHDLQEQIQLQPPMPHRDCLRQMALADAFILLQPGTATQVPGKIFEMISFGKPIIALTGEGASADLVRQYSLGVVADPSSADCIATAVREVITHHAMYSDPSRWTQARLDYDGITLTQKLAEKLIEATRGDHRPPASRVDRIEPSVHQEPFTTNERTGMVSS